MWIILIIVALLIALMAVPLLVRERRRGDGKSQNAVWNARSLGLALDQFATEFGSFPDELTALKIHAQIGTDWKLTGKSANDPLRQLIAAGILKSEADFYAKTAFSVKPDNRCENTDTAIGPGELGFGYLMNGTRALDRSGNPARGILCAPLAMEQGAVSSKFFDPAPYGGKAVILRIDTSVQAVPIEKDSKLAMLGGGKSLLDTGLDTVWGESVTPVIVPPLPKR